MIHAVYFDILFAFVSVTLGLLLFVTRMSFKRCGCVSSPFAGIAVLCLGSLSWLAFGFLALSALLDYGGLHTIGYRGHWGYTSARLLAFLAWLAMMSVIRTSFVEHDKCKLNTKQTAL
ncbi:hypothetical protein [Psychrobacter sp.]|uniref:hypothetical protein n=1 Tax=Psychrobacter sp. TaxID=56811 RepID=UPI003F9CE10F